MRQQRPDRSSQEPLLQPNLGPLWENLQKWCSLILAVVGTKLCVSGLLEEDRDQQLVGAILVVVGFALAVTRSFWDPSSSSSSWRKAKTRQDGAVHLGAWLMGDAATYIAAVGGAGGALYGWAGGGLSQSLIGLAVGFAAGFALGMLLAGIGYLFARIL